MIGAIVLAAGSSRRFGDDKRRATLPNGKTVIQQAVETVLNSFDDLLLVLRYGDAQFEQEITALIDSPNLRTFRAPDSALGMGHSLANAVVQIDDWTGAFIFLADMPDIQDSTIEQLKTQLSEKRIVVPTFDGQYGHPVGFSSDFFAEIAQLEGDSGAKPVISANQGSVVEIVVDDPGVLKDVDRPEDL